MKISIVTYSSSQWVLVMSPPPPPITTHLNVFRWSIVNSNSDSEHRVLCPKNYLNLHENLLEIYLKLLVSNYWGGGGGVVVERGVAVPKTASKQTGEIKMCSSVELAEGSLRTGREFKESLFVLGVRNPITSCQSFRKK